MGEPLCTVYEVYTADKELAEGLVEQIEAELDYEAEEVAVILLPGTMWEGNEVAPIRGERADFIRKAIECGAGVRLLCPELNYGVREEFEHWCMAHGVAFNVTIESKYDIQGEMRWWRPGMVHQANQDVFALTKSIEVNQYGAPVLTVKAIEEELEGYEGMTPEEILPSLWAWLGQVAPPPLDAKHLDEEE